MTNLFTYGSLMCSDIMENVSRQSTPHKKGVLDGYFRSQIHGETYPAIIAQPGQQVEGIVYFDLTATAIAQLDIFEGGYYCRKEVIVNCEDMLQVSAMAYILKSEFLYVSYGKTWSYDDFLAKGKKAFLSNYKGFEDI